MPFLFVAGDMRAVTFQLAKLIADDVVHNGSQLELETMSLVEADWVDYLRKKSLELGSRAFRHDVRQPLVVHSAEGYIGGVDDLIAWAARTYQYADPRKEKEYAQVETHLATLAAEDFARYIQRSPNPFCYLDYTFAGSASKGDDVGRLIFELYADKLPKTTANFLALCTGEQGKVPENDDAHTAAHAGVALHYKGAPVHRVVKDGWIQGGDIVSGRGDSGVSVYGTTFPDESFAVKHDRKGVLSMARGRSPHTNASQFFVTMQPMPCFDFSRVAFGRVVTGFETLDRINNVTLNNQRPVAPIVISDAGTFAPEVVPTANSAAWRHISPRINKSANGGGAAAVTAGGAKAASPGPQRDATVLVIGLDNAGKSTLVASLTGEVDAFNAPTNGLELRRIEYDTGANGSVNTGAGGRYNVKFISLGGGAGIRGYWDGFFDEVHGVVYVVDAADAAADRLAESAKAFADVVAAARVAGKPVLVLANKQDLSATATLTPATDIARALKLDSLTTSASKLCKTTALLQPSGGVDTAVDVGLSWLLDAVGKDYTALSERVAADVAARKAQEKEAAKAAAAARAAAAKE